MRAILQTAVLAILAVAGGCRQSAANAARDGADQDPWLFVAVPTNASLRALAIAGDGAVWVGGAGGTLLRTVDGGATWQDVAPQGSQACDFRDVEAFDRDAAVVMVAGQPARVYRTADGGRTWAIVHEDPRREAFFDAMAFRGRWGALVGDPIDGAFAVLRTEDAGATWQPVAAAQVPPAAAGEAAFAASGTCVGAGGPLSVVLSDPFSVAIVTGGGAVRLLRSGSGPRAMDLPLRRGGASRGAFSLAAWGEPWTRAVVVGGDHERPLECEGTAAWSDDGGATWCASDGGAGGYRSCAVWLDAATVLAVGSHGASRSRDGGRTWRPFGAAGFHTVAKGPDGQVWACGSDGRVARLASGAAGACAR